MILQLRSLSLAALAVALLAAPAMARPRPQNTPMADAQLFISPCGQAYRSQPGEPYPVVAWFQAVDANHDGKIDREEFKAEAAGFFHQLDLRKNGIIDDEIISLYEHKVVPEILSGLTGTVLRRDGGGRLIRVQAAAQGLGPLDPGGPVDPNDRHPHEEDGPPKGASAFGLLDDAEPIRSADRSFRSQIKLQDMLDQADRNFDALDQDKRGYLTLEDLPRTPVQERARAARK